MNKPVKLSRLRPLIDWKVRWQLQDPSPDYGPQAGVPGTAPTKVDGDSLA